SANIDSPIGSLIGDNHGTGLIESHTPDAHGNLIGSSTGSGIIDPRLGPLSNNGGLTQTQALLAGSPAIDAFNYLDVPVTHDYGLNNSLVDSRGGPSLGSLGGQLTATGYKFGANQGLTLSSASINAAKYSIELFFSWDALPIGWKKIIDFHDRT